MEAVSYKICSSVFVAWMIIIIILIIIIIIVIIITIIVYMDKIA